MTSITPAHPTRALVLGGGGSAGNAWLIGVLAGLADAGLDLTGADLVIGTSAGATAGAQLAHATAGELLDAVLAAPAPPPRASAAGGGGSVPDHLAHTDRLIAASTDAADMRRRMGADAIAADDAGDGAWSARWRAIVASRLGGLDWPARPLRITAVDATTGDPVVFDRESGVDLVDAVAASTSGGGTAYRIGDRRFIDGGYRRNENADLATGCDVVVVLSPLGGRTRHPLDWGLQLDAQVAELTGSGSRVETLLPDADSLAAFGGDLMDPATRPPAARAGFAQGRATAERLAPIWRGGTAPSSVTDRVGA